MAKSMDSLSKTPADKPAETPVAAPAAAQPAVPVTASSTSPAVAPSSPPQSGGDDSYATLFPEPTVAIEGPPQWVWWVLLVIGSVVLGLVGFRVLNGGYASGIVATSATATPAPTVTVTPAATATPTNTPVATASPTPAPTATADKKSITMRVLNGTKTAGLAATTRTTLQNAGFSVRAIGNATNQTYASTVIYYASGHQADAEQVKAALSAYAPTLEESSLAAPDNVLVVVGPH